MESCLSHTKIHHFSSPLFIPKSKFPSIHPQSTQIYSRSLMLVGPRRSGGGGEDGDSGWSMVECAKGSSFRELEDEMNSELDEWVGIGRRWRDKCKERRGIAELMECLEREAIMGEDEGREPSDYNRRAMIFDKSSRVFQALKETKTPHDS